GVEVNVMVYDRLNRLKSRTNPDGKTIAYRYDTQGNRAKVTDSDSVATDYVYDARNRIDTITTGSQVTKYAYWPDSLLRTVTYPNASVNETTYDKADRAAKIVNHDGTPASPISEYDYSYDANGNRQQQVEVHRRITGGTPQTTTYGYDRLNRV